MWWLLTALCNAQVPAPPDTPAPPPADEDTLPRFGQQLPGADRPHRVELSFGSSLLFVEQAMLSGQVLDPEIVQRVVPVPSLLMLGEWIWTPRWSTGMMLNVPTGTITQIDESGEISERHSAAAVALGPGFAPINQRVLYDATLRWQSSAMLGRTINHQGGNRSFPLVTTRLMVLTPAGTSMYAGVAYAFQEETLALIYGVGTRF